MITIDGSLSAYRAEPTGEPRGALILIHEIWGLVGHITDVADRFAAEGYLVIAPDILSEVGVDPAVGDELQRLVFSADEKTRTEAQPIMREKLAPSHAPEYAEWAVAQLTKVVDYLAEQPGIDGRIAVTGFCFGGGYSFALAAADSRVRAAVPFYGYPPVPDAVSAIECPVLAFYGDLDDRLMESLPELSATMSSAGVDFRPQVYPGARHAFFNDTNSITYNPVAARAAWTQALTFLDEALPN